jgi:hypothetical protein
MQLARVSWLLLLLGGCLLFGVQAQEEGEEEGEAPAEEEAEAPADEAEAAPPAEEGGDAAPAVEAEAPAAEVGAVSKLSPKNHYAMIWVPDPVPDPDPKSTFPKQFKIWITPRNFMQANI